MDEIILIDTIFFIYKRIDFLAIVVFSLIALWLSSISSGWILRLALFLLAILIVTPYIFAAAYILLIMSVSLMFAYN
ncbi:hypothetical protein AYY18_12615 [Morganella psychrotolerans]|uniref:Uncharacterized protein n=1 Tax=Morganella psychrotolerans TaxID=368603 RepID=A0A1B8GZH0_9GAMM|nr:hypothetical protein AYY18_12615 [Morganella psychrotolerans]